jgi:sterol desaturase/sphingolipid hydroxylase (fatty acid hydroxylase superfamily)
MEDIVGYLITNAPIWAEHWMRAFTRDFIRYLVGAAGVFIVVWGILRPFIQSRKIRKKTPPARQMVFEFLHSVKTVAVFSTVGLLIGYGYQAGIFKIYLDLADYGWGYFAFSTLLMIFLHDTYFYWTHRLLHVSGIFPRVHGLHHKSHNPTPWTAYSFDWIEAIVNFMFVKFFLLIVPMHPLGIFSFLAFMIVRNAIGHSGYELFPRRWVTHPIFGQLTNVTHHDLHHATFRYNYGLYFTYWDRLMGTEHPDYVAKTLGIKGARRKSGGGVFIPDNNPDIVPAE